ncbi:hypothetical protein [Actinoplanes flavus]|uniref:Uncharacterized protein n=1 Tax=Actinoplanes flavus TaxID=2820290 RepID=A0ABS3UTG5_9ACTN|nr:hypothetical protein [Actinoplanes flavus]MBO3741872.1 hypothetical protein [Actinoplanes flavus]
MILDAFALLARWGRARSSFGVPTPPAAPVADRAPASRPPRDPPETADGDGTAPTRCRRR